MIAITSKYFKGFLACCYFIYYIFSSNVTILKCFDFQDIISSPNHTSTYCVVPFFATIDCVFLLFCVKFINSFSIVYEFALIIFSPKILSRHYIRHHIRYRYYLRSFRKNLRIVRHFHRVFCHFLIHFFLP